MSQRASFFALNDMIKDYHRNLEAAQGYCELGMSEDALSELASVPRELQSHASFPVGSM